MSEDNVTSMFGGVGETPRKSKGGRPKNRSTQPDTNFDTWEGYNPANIYPRSEDSKGHGGSKTVNFPRDILAQIEKYSDLHPDFRYAGDFYRTAAVHYLHYCATLSDEAFRSWVADSMNREESAQRAQRNKNDKVEVALSEERLQTYRQDRDLVALKLELQDAERWAEGRPKHIVEAVARLRETFGHLVKDEEYEA